MSTPLVTKAMIESYALMIMVMGGFFLYFCGMVWCFLSTADDEAYREAAERGYIAGGEVLTAAAPDCWVCAQNPQERWNHCTGAHRGTSQKKTGDRLAETTYINFLDDTDSLLSDHLGVCCEDHGTINYCNIGDRSSITYKNQSWCTLD